MGDKKEVSLDELLAKQSRTTTLATIETVPDKPDFVKVTPWIAGRGCICRLALEVPKQDIAKIVLSPHSHSCCGKTLSVVEVEFRQDSVLPVADVFANLSHLASSGSDLRRVLETNHAKWSPALTGITAALLEAGNRAKSNPGSGPADPDFFLVDIFRRIFRFGTCIANALQYGSINAEQFRACVEQWDDPLEG